MSKQRKTSVVENDGETYEDALKRYGLSPSKNGHYVDKAELYRNMVAYCEARDREKAEEGITRLNRKKNLLDEFPYISESIVKIANHLSYLPNFSGYTYREDFVEDAILNCCEYVDNFNPQISKNPFAYFTQICWYAFIRRIMKEKKQSIVKGKLIMGMPYDEALMIDEDINKAVMEDTLRNTHTFVELAAEEDKKQKQKAEERKAAREAKRAKQKEQTSLEELFE